MSESLNLQPRCHLCGIKYTINEKTGKKARSVKCWKLFPDIEQDGSILSWLAKFKIVPLKRKGHANGDGSICARCHNGIKVIENVVQKWEEWGNINLLEDERPPKRIFVQEVSIKTN